MLLVFEGIDGSGKSEQVDRFRRVLRARRISCTVIGTRAQRPIRDLYRRLAASEASFPTPTTSIFLALGDFASALAAADARAGPCRVVLMHRYVYSALADAVALGIALDRVLPTARLFARPEAVVYVATPARTALARKPSLSLAEAGGPAFVRRYGTRERAFVEFQSRVNRAYEALLPKLVSARSLIRIDGSASPGAVARQIRIGLEAVLDRGSRRSESPCAAEL